MTSLKRKINYWEDYKKGVICHTQTLKILDEAEKGTINILEERISIMVPIFLKTNA